MIRLYLLYLLFVIAGKDYIPGPGEYDLSNEDRNKHKRFGFLSHTNRFPDGSGNKVFFFF